jgi:hypothetical protein
LLSQEKKPEALKVYQEINLNSSDQYIKELAGLLYVKLLIENPNNLEKEKIVKSIEAVESKSKLLKNLVTEQRAIFEMQSGNLEKSYKILNSIQKDKTSTEELKSRAKDMMRLVISKGYDL